MTTEGERQAARRGLCAAMFAFVCWGVFPLYYRAIDGVSPFEIVAHRVLWSALFLAGLLGFVPRLGSFAAVRAALRIPRLFGLLTLTALLIGSNWLVFVWAIDQHRLLEASLGYFINPLINIVLGRLFLGERLTPWQSWAVMIATAGVGLRVWQVGAPPWIALYLAVTFGLYGLLRKQTAIGVVGGLFVETALTLPFALVGLLWLGQQDMLTFGHALRVDLLLPLSGVLTVVPLLLFTIGARHLPLATLGFAQYLSPTLSFLVAVLVFGEAVSLVQLAGFGLIWVALALYSADMLRRGNQKE
jgi:chloramphenicol-sensitive protein RarD